MSRLGERFKRLLDNFIVTEESKDVYFKIQEYAENFNEGYKTNRYYSFRVRNWKNISGKSAVNHLIKQNISAIFITVPDLLMKIRSTYSNNEFTEEKLMNGLMDCQLLVLDDVGSESHKNTSDWATEKLFQIINNRYNDLKATIFTTNCNLQELNNKLTGKTFSRIAEMTKGLGLI